MKFKRQSQCKSDVWFNKQKRGCIPIQGAGVHVAECGGCALYRGLTPSFKKKRSIVVHFLTVPYHLLHVHGAVATFWFPFHSMSPLLLERSYPLKWWSFLLHLTSATHVDAHVVGSAETCSCIVNGL